MLSKIAYENAYATAVISALFPSCDLSVGSNLKNGTGTGTTAFLIVLVYHTCKAYGRLCAKLNSPCLIT